MIVTPAAVPDAYVLAGAAFHDERGCFAELVRSGELAAATGRPFTTAQVNVSVSRAGTLRGLHGVAVPPGQQKVVVCLSGSVVDVVVDLRPGSPTFGRHHVTRLRAAAEAVATGDPAAVYVGDGLGHAFLAEVDGTCVAYLCSTEHVPGTQLDLDPLDPALGLPWTARDVRVVSAKDRRAPTLAEAAARGLLPTPEACDALVRADRAAAARDRAGVTGT